MVIGFNAESNLQHLDRFNNLLALGLSAFGIGDRQTEIL